MNDLLFTLAKNGCKDLPKTLERFLNDEQFYRSLLAQMLDDEGFEQLGEALRQQDIQKSFEISHTLKGIIGMCGIDPMYELIQEIVEPLRAKENTNLLPVYDQLMDQRAFFQEILKSCTN